MTRSNDLYSRTTATSFKIWTVFHRGRFRITGHVFSLLGQNGSPEKPRWLHQDVSVPGEYRSTSTDLCDDDEVRGHETNNQTLQVIRMFGHISVCSQCFCLLCASAPTSLLLLVSPLPPSLLPISSPPPSSILYLWAPHFKSMRYWADQCL